MDLLGLKTWIPPTRVKQFVLHARLGMQSNAYRFTGQVIRAHHRTTRGTPVGWATRRDYKEEKKKHEREVHIEQENRKESAHNQETNLPSLSWGPLGFKASKHSREIHIQ